MHNVYKTEFPIENQNGFTPQKNTIDAAMEARKFIEHQLEKGRIELMAILDVKGSIDTAWL
jgi:hypothetical protein